MKKVFLAMLVAMTVVFLPVISNSSDLSLAPGRIVRAADDSYWQQSDNNWYYYSNGSAVTGWQKIGGKYYFFDESDGKMVTGWLNQGNKWYYLLPDGQMKQGWLKLGTEYYFFDANGAMATGWIKDGNDWYYLMPDGNMKTGWFKSGSNYYYFKSSGAMATGFVKDNGKWYYMDQTTGHMMTGWKKVDGLWYYMDPNSGMMITGWFRYNNSWYYFTQSGAMRIGWAKVNGDYYYLDKNGVMYTGWLKENKTWYYMNPTTGAMAVGWNYIGGYKYYMKADGSLCQNVDSIIGKQSSYYLTVNTTENVVTVYAYDYYKESYCIPVKVMPCSCGLPDTPTILGTFTTENCGRWRQLSGGVWGQYCTRISGNYLFHSAWFYEEGNIYSISVKQFDKLGNNASHGCVRLQVADAKWIYENCNNCTVKVTTSCFTPFDKPVTPYAVVVNGDYGYDPNDPGL